MRYDGKTKNSECTTIYTFSVGEGELEILAKLMQISYDNVPKTFETMQYRGRVRNMHKVFGQVFVEEIKGKQLPTVKTSRTHRRIKEHLESN